MECNDESMTSMLCVLWENGVGVFTWKENSTFGCILHG